MIDSDRVLEMHVYKISADRPTAIIIITTIHSDFIIDKFDTSEDPTLSDMYKITKELLSNFEDIGLILKIDTFDYFITTRSFP